MTQHIPSLPQNIDPRIADILRKRAEQGTVINKTITLPPRRVPPLAPDLEAQSVPSLDTPAQTWTAEVPVSDTELAGLLAQVLGRADTLIRGLIAGIRSDGRLTLVEALSLAPDVRNIVSQVVGEVLPQIKGSSARELVILVLATLIQQYVSPHLPALVRPYLTAQTLRVLVSGLEHAYRNWIAPKLKK